MSTLAFNNYRLAQFNQGNPMGTQTGVQPAPQVQSPNTFNNAQQSAPPTTPTQQASVPGASVTPEQKGAQDKAAEQQAQMKQVLSTWFNTVMEVKKSIVYYGRIGVSLSRSPVVVQFVKNELPSLLRFEILEAWLTNALANRYDVIFNNLRSTNLGKIATDAEIVQLAKTLKDQMSRSVGRKLGLNGQEYLELLQKVKAAKAARPFNVLNSALKIDDLIKQIDVLLPKAAGEQLKQLKNLKSMLTAQQSSLINSTDAKNINKTLNKIDEVIKAEQNLINMIDPKAGANILKTVENEAKPVNRALQMAAKLGENPTAGRKAAVASLNVFKSAVMKIPALKGLATALEFAGKNLPIIDLLLSSADFAQFVFEMNKGTVKLDDPEHPEYLPLFVFSAFKILLSISMVVAPPLIPILLPFDLVISGAQFLTPGIQQAASKWLNADTNEIQRISEQAVGTPPTNSDAKIVYDWVLKNGFKESITKIVIKDLNVNWNTFNDKWVQDAIKTFLNEAPGNIVDSAHAKTLFGQISWLTELDDTRYLELYQSLLGTAMNIIKAAKQNPAPFESGKQKKEAYVPPFINYNKPVKSNKVYNNRRSVLCPSI